MSEVGATVAGRTTGCRSPRGRAARALMAAAMVIGGLALVPVAPPGTADAAELSFGVASSMEQLRPTATLAGRPTSASLVAAQNETESFQVLIEGPTTDVAASGDLFGWGTTTLYRAADYQVVEPSDAEGAAGVWRDALIPETDLMYGENRNAFPFDVPAGQNAVVWVDVHVPEGTPAGMYNSSIALTSTEFGTTTVPVTLEVVGLELPSTSTLRSAFYMTYDGSDDYVCRAHTGNATCDNDPVLRRELYQLYSRMALENRFSIANGSGLRNDQAPSAFPDAAWESGYEAPAIAGTTDVPSTADYRVQGARSSVVGVFSYANFHCLAACIANWRTEAEEVARPFADRFVIYGCDEPNDNASKWAACGTNLTSAKSAWNAPALVTATIGQYNTYAAPNGLPASQILVPPINRIHDRPGTSLAGDQRNTYDTFLQTPGNELWLYASCLSNGCGGDTFGSPSGYWDGWPGYAIDSPAVQHRAMGWMSWRYRATGELYWAVAQRLPGAWQTGGQFESGANGDGTLFYPGSPSVIGGSHHIPLESVRMKRIRDGREDHELMTILAANGQGAAVDQIVQSLFPTAYSAVPALDGTGVGSLLSSREQLFAIARTVAPPSTSPESVAYASNIDGDYEIFTVPAAGGTPDQLTNNAVLDRFPAWSPDGRRIAWTSGADVWVMNADGSGAVNLTADIAATCEKPAWSPDGQLVFVRAEGGFTDIWKMNGDGSSKAPLVTYASGGISAYDPAVDTAGRVVFNLGEDLYRIGLDGAGITALVTGAPVDEVIDVGAATGRLTFSRSVGGAPYDVMTAGADASGIANVTNRPVGNDFQSTWSPDESRLAFVSDRSASLDLWTMNADGTNPVSLVAGPGSELDPDWSPDLAQGTVAGTVTDAVSGAPVPGAFVAVLRTNDFSIAAAVVADGSGSFSVSVPPGGYFPYLIDPSATHTAGFSVGDPLVTVPAGTVVDADLAMAPLRGAISGTVTEEGTGDPIANALVFSLTNGGAAEIATVADNNGDYTLPGLRTGNHYVAFADPAGNHRSEFWPNSPNVPDATTLAVNAGGTTTADSALPTQTGTSTGSPLTGTVVETGTLNPLQGVVVLALHATDFRLARAATTNVAGQYSLDVQAGLGYKLAFYDGTGLHNFEWHDNQPNTGLGTAATVVAPAATNASLDRNTGSVSGAVTDQTSGDPLAGAWVFAIGPTGIAGGTVTAPNGTYTIANLAPGTYRATFVDPNGGRAQEYFDNSPDYTGATPFNITAATNTPNINAALAQP